MGSLVVGDEDPCLPLEISADINEAKSILFPLAAWALAGEFEELKCNFLPEMSFTPGVQSYRADS